MDHTEPSFKIVYIEEEEPLKILSCIDILFHRPLFIEIKDDSDIVESYLNDFGYFKISFGLYRRNYYTQFHGEILCEFQMDKILREYFPDYNCVGVFIDVGAYSPIKMSNSYHFERNEWQVYCIEANPNLIPKLKKHRKNVYNYAVYDVDKEKTKFHIVYGPWGGKKDTTAGCSAIELDPQYLKDNESQITKIEKIEVEQITLNTFIQNQQIKEIDILKIDVEGGEYKVLKGIDLEKHRPKVILVEDSYSNEKLDIYLTRHRYLLHKTFRYNKFYISV